MTRFLGLVLGFTLSGLIIREWALLSSFGGVEVVGARKKKSAKREKLKFRSTEQ